jgi:hypothetical protein
MPEDVRGMNIDAGVFLGNTNQVVMIKNDA